MIIEGYELSLVNHPRAHVPIYPHQAALIDAWDGHDAFLLATKTGSGKTAAWLLAYLTHLTTPDERNVVCVYPTNELMRDQARSIEDFIVNRHGLTCHMRAPGDDGPAGADIEIVKVDAAELEHYRVAFHCRTKGDALQQLLHSDRPKIILTNPDTLYQLFAQRYRQSAHTLGFLQAYRTVVFDEFHL
jgi:CRISPR-associated helicase Cas3